MISSLKSWMFHRSLKGHRNYTRKINFSGVNHCNKICLIGDGDSESSRAELRRYSGQLQSMGKDVDTVFYYNSKLKTDDGYAKQNVKWNGTPHHPLIEDILSREYDLMIYLYPSLENHLSYIAKLCQAKLKIGPNFLNGSEYFNVLIAQEPFDDTSAMIKQVDTQLRLLSK